MACSVAAVGDGALLAVGSELVTEALAAGDPEPEALEEGHPLRHGQHLDLAVSSCPLQQALDEQRADSLADVRVGDGE